MFRLFIIFNFCFAFIHSVQLSDLSILPYETIARELDPTSVKSLQNSNRQVRQNMRDIIKQFNESFTDIFHTCGFDVLSAISPSLWQFRRSFNLSDDMIHDDYFHVSQYTDDCLRKFERVPGLYGNLNRLYITGNLSQSQYNFIDNAFKYQDANFDGIILDFNKIDLNETGMLLDLMTRVRRVSLLSIINVDISHSQQILTFLSSTKAFRVCLTTRYHEQDFASRLDWVMNSPIPLMVVNYKEFPERFLYTQDRFVVPFNVSGQKSVYMIKYWSQLFPPYKGEYLFSLNIYRIMHRKDCEKVFNVLLNRFPYLNLLSLYFEGDHDFYKSMNKYLRRNLNLENLTVFFGRGTRKFFQISLLEKSKVRTLSLGLKYNSARISNLLRFIDNSNNLEHLSVYFYNDRDISIPKFIKFLKKLVTVLSRKPQITIINIRVRITYKKNIRKVEFIQYLHEISSIFQILGDRSLKVNGRRIMQYIQEFVYSHTWINDDRVAVGRVFAMEYPLPDQSKELVKQVYT